MVEDPTVLTLVLMALAAFTAGVVDAIVGGGGLIQLPALVLGFPQASPAQLLATNKVGSIFGTSTASATYLRHIRPDWHIAAPLVGCALAGSVGGAFIGLRIPKAAFNPIILVLLIVVGGYTLLKPQLGTQTMLRFTGRHGAWRAGLIGLVIGVYDGALGPGTGSFLLFAIVGWLGYAFLQATVTTKLGNFATNLGALVVFAPMGLIMWKVALVIGPANLLGGYVGARTAVRLGSGFVRWAFIAIVSAFSVKIGGSLLGLWS